jgi:transcription termination factor Rho
MGKKKQRSKGGSNGRGRASSQQRNRRRRRPSDQHRRHNAPDNEPIENGDAPLEPGYGMLEMHPNGYGFLRSPENNYSRERTDPFVPGTMIDRYGLRQGLMIRANVQHARKQQGPRVREILDVDGMPPEEYTNVKTFDSLTPINPEVWYRLETGPEPLSTRIMARRFCFSTSVREYRPTTPV